MPSYAKSTIVGCGRFEGLDGYRNQPVDWCIRIHRDLESFDFFDTEVFGIRRLWLGYFRLPRFRLWKFETLNDRNVLEF